MIPYIGSAVNGAAGIAQGKSIHPPCASSRVQSPVPLKSLFTPVHLTSLVLVMEEVVSVTK